MNMEVFRGVMIPFMGTALGAACVLFMKGKHRVIVQKSCLLAGENYEEDSYCNERN